jgi:hypothetical protein
MSGLTRDEACRQFEDAIAGFPLLDRYLKPSLERRLQEDTWFENRVIRYILQGCDWVTGLEQEFEGADLDSISNSSDIFDVLRDTGYEYDQKLFDAIAEVRLVRWARFEGYQGIEKLAPGGNSRTPDFRMTKQGQVVLAEAKRFRERDYLPEFIVDRLQGLALTTGALSGFGLEVVATRHYVGGRNDSVTDRNRSGWIQCARGELTEDWLRGLGRRFHSAPQVEILGDLLAVRRTQRAGAVDLQLSGGSDRVKTVMLMLSKLRGELMTKLCQIKEFMDATRTRANEAIVFLSGIDEDQTEWSYFWSLLDHSEQWAWGCVAQMKKDADALIGMPFELIIVRLKKERGPRGEVCYGPMVYAPFLWRPETTLREWSANFNQG